LWSGNENFESRPYLFYVDDDATRAIKLQHFDSWFIFQQCYMSSIEKFFLVFI